MQDSRKLQNPIKPGTLSRRLLYTKIIAFQTKIELPMFWTGVIAGIAILLAPVISVKWKSIVSNIPFLMATYETITRMGEPFYIVIIGAIFFNILTIFFVRKISGPAWGIHDWRRLPTSREVLENDLLPRRFNEEVALIMWAIDRFIITFSGFAMIGCLAFFLRLGEFK
jgi:hypothetical protein